MPNTLDLIVQKVNDQHTQHEAAQIRLNTEKAVYEEKRTLVSRLEAARTIAQLVAADVQVRAHSRIASVVTQCLSLVFDDPYTFEIKFERKRGKTEARMVFVRDGQEVDPLDAAGGGVVDVAAFALRCAALSMRVPRPRPFVVLDEPFRFVAAHLQDRLREMLETMSEELGFQFVLVTHEEALTKGHIVRL